eukprot:TRINITY_DN18030_c0_g1_i1.p1 TRINITY_DN18030_c0_g1~~TRINITY_DN18030_c0_g1_i1.p1  ORF type:complete len:72 (-),score=25.37 TRINITY_DN18030_c0_g1_i1:342-557(-)
MMNTTLLYTNERMSDSGNLPQALGTNAQQLVTQENGQQELESSQLTAISNEIVQSLEKAPAVPSIPQTPNN